jgi:hypothetical protein
MGTVIQFPASGHTDVLRDVFWDRASWRKSARGNWWVQCGGHPVTLFQRRTPSGAWGWAWSIGRSKREGGTIYAKMGYADAKDAHAAAWSALEQFVLAKSA